MLQLTELVRRSVRIFFLPKSERIRTPGKTSQACMACLVMENEPVMMAWLADDGGPGSQAQTNG